MPDIMASHRNVAAGIPQQTPHLSHNLSMHQMGRLFRSHSASILQQILDGLGKMPWLPGSPFRTAPPDTPGPERLPPGDGETMSISHILALRDGATGTIPLSRQHSVSVLLKADVPRFVAMIPRIVWAEATRLASKQGSTTWKDTLEGCLYILLSALEIQLVLTAIPIWMLTPGLVGLPLVLAQLALIWALIRVVNWGGREFVARGEVRRSAWEPNWDNSSWAVVGGLNWSEDHLRNSTCPRLARLFGHDMHVFLPYRLGLLLDLAVMLAQRTLQIPTPLSLAVYKHVRAHCLRPQPGQLNLIVHNTGALDMAWVMACLCSDLPPGQLLGRFNVYTFGAATTEMALPLGSHTGHEGHSCSCESLPEYPLVNHYAFGDDPFARIGVLQGVWHRMQGRLVGAVYVIQRMQARGWLSWTPTGHSYSLDDYLDALFPNGNPRAGVLGQVCRIERDLSVMRELAALANAATDQPSVSSRHSRTLSGASSVSPRSTPRSSPRNSAWSGGHRRSGSNIAGLVSLEEARRIGKESEGMFGYENNALAALVVGKHRLSEDEQTGVRRRASSIYGGTPPHRHGPV